MSAKLIAISGHLHPATFELGQNDFSVGRDAANTAHLDDPEVSRRHCLIRCTADSYVLEDLGSRNGTMVNDVAVTRQELNDGDRIAIANHVFVFSTGDPTQLLSVVVARTGDEKVEFSAVQTAGNVALNTQRLLGSAGSARPARNLRAILDINRKASSSRDPEALQLSMLDLAFELTSAERAAVLIYDQQEGPPASMLGRERKLATSRNIAVSRTVIERVRRQKVAVLARDLQLEEQLKSKASILNIGCNSILCVPLMSLEKLLGVLYLDSREMRAFDDLDLETLTAVGGVVGMALENALEFQRLQRQTELLRADVDQDRLIVGETPAMKALYATLLKVAVTDSNVILLGESGTGKELAARAIHRNSPRCDKAFCAINCATLSDNLLESELFGHEKGAFTGAVGLKKGLLETADGGTVFLDEVAELPLTVQAKMLRVLQEREFSRLGSTRPIKVNVRLIAATVKDLRAAVTAGSFREDLWHRLNVVALRMPPLRERREDIPLLANFFLARSSQRCERRVLGMTPEAREFVQHYDWPGNVRELENAIERAVVLGSDSEIQVNDLPETIWEGAPASPGSLTYHAALSEAKKKIVTQALESTGGNYAEAARRLGVHVTYLHRLMKAFKMKQAAPDESD